MAAEYPALKWRLDFNESLEPGCRGGISEQACAEQDARGHRFRGGSLPVFGHHVDGAAPPDAGETGGGPRGRAASARAAQVMVIKPAIDEPFLLAEAALRQPPAGGGDQLHGSPARPGLRGVGGGAAGPAVSRPGRGCADCRRIILFEPDAFTELLGPWSPAFQPPAGNGLGFDDLLDALPWTRHY